MATENKKLNGRLQLKHDTEANWIKAVNFIPLAGEMIIYDADDANPVRVKIGDGTTKVNDLPFYNEKVQADWNQNDSVADDYIKNRTHWVEAATELIVDAQEIDITHTNLWSSADITDKMLLIPADTDISNESFIVTFDSVDYTCQSWSPTLEAIYIGNSRLAGPEENNAWYWENPEDVPFLIEIYYEPDGWSMRYVSTTIYTGTDFSRVRNLKIKHILPDQINYHQLDENYIPDTIARKTYVDEELAKFDIVAISDDEIDEICGGAIAYAEDVMF